MLKTIRHLKERVSITEHSRRWNDPNLSSLWFYKIKFYAFDVLGYKRKGPEKFRWNFENHLSHASSDDDLTIDFSQVSQYFGIFIFGLQKGWGIVSDTVSCLPLLSSDDYTHLFWTLIFLKWSGQIRSNLLLGNFKS